MIIKRFNHKPHTILIDINRVHLGGQYAAMQRAYQQSKQKENVEPVEITNKKKIQETTQQPIENKIDSRKEYIACIKRNIQRSHYFWMEIYAYYDAYYGSLTESEYVDIAKFAINLYPTQLSRVLDEKISANNYYEICKVMAKRGYFHSIKYEKLKQAKISGVQNPVFDIVKIAIENCRGTDHLNYTYGEIINFLRQYDPNMLSMIGRKQKQGR